MDTCTYLGIATPSHFRWELNTRKFDTRQCFYRIFGILVFCIDFSFPRALSRESSVLPDSGRCGSVDRRHQTELTQNCTIFGTIGRVLDVCVIFGKHRRARTRWIAICQRTAQQWWHFIIISSKLVRTN